MKEAPGFWKGLDAKKLFPKASTVGANTVATPSTRAPSGASGSSLPGLGRKAAGTAHPDKAAVLAREARLQGFFRQRLLLSPPPARGSQQLPGTSLARAHPSRTAGQAHSSRPSPLPPPPRGIPCASALLPGRCCTHHSETGLGQSLLRAPRRHHQQAPARPLIPREPTHQPQTHALLSKRPLRFPLYKKAPLQPANKLFVSWKEMCRVMHPTTWSQWKSFLMPLTELGRGVGMGRAQSVCPKFIRRNQCLTFWSLHLRMAHPRSKQKQPTQGKISSVTHKYTLIIYKCT